MLQKLKKAAGFLLRDLNPEMETLDDMLELIIRSAHKVKITPLALAEHLFKTDFFSLTDFRWIKREMLKKAA